MSGRRPAMTTKGLTAVLAGIEIALSVLLFFSTMMYARNTAPSRQTSAQPGA